MSRDQNVERLRAFSEAWGQKARTQEDWRQEEVIDLSMLDPDVVYEDANLPDHAGERYHGHDGVVRAAQRWIEPNEWLLVELERIVGAGDCLVSIHRMRSKARYTGIEFDAPLAYLWRFRDGKVTYFRSFVDPSEALKVAGLKE